MTPEVVTIVTLHRARMAEVFVGAVAGSMTDEEQAAYAGGWDLDDEDELGFRVVRVAETHAALTELLNAYTDD